MLRVGPDPALSARRRRHNRREAAAGSGGTAGASLGAYMAWTASCGCHVSPIQPTPPTRARTTRVPLLQTCEPQLCNKLAVCCLPRYTRVTQCIVVLYGLCLVCGTVGPQVCNELTDELLARLKIQSEKTGTLDQALPGYYGTHARPLALWHKQASAWRCATCSWNMLDSEDSLIGCKIELQMFRRDMAGATQVRAFA